jgi:hypothetical protein
MISITYWWISEKYGLKILLLFCLARSVAGGHIESRISFEEWTEFPLGQAVEVYSKLKAGQITGRAVLIPDGA